MNKRVYLSIFLMAIVFQSCKTWVHICPSNYVPTFENKFSSYSGKTLCFADVIHEDPNNDLWTYKSKYYFKTWYEVSTDLPSFFAESFKMSFVYIGINICESESLPGMPVMRIILLSLTDMEFKLKVNLVGKGVSFSKIYIVKEPPPKSKEYLEERAYRMVGKMIENILSDQDFNRAFLQAN